MRRTWPSAVILASTFSAGIFAAGAAPGQRSTREQQVVVSVLDRDDKPVAGLTPADFAVREDEVAREVLRVEQASAPMQIALLVDTSANTQVILQDLRKGLQSFSTEVWAKSPDSDITLMEFGERPAQLSPPTTNAGILNRAIDRVFEHAGSGSYLLEAIDDAAKSLKKRDAKRPVIVAFIREASPEFSTARYQDVETALKSSHASLWAIELQESRGPSGGDEVRDRNVVLGDVTTESGGMRDSLLDRMGVTLRFTQLANRLTSQYAVIYSRPDALIPATRLDVGVKRPNMHVLAPHWTGQ